MRYFIPIIAALLLVGCSADTVELAGTMQDGDGSIVTILDQTYKTVFTTVIKNNRFDIKQLVLPEKGYYTLSVQSGAYPRDFEIYLEPGKYVIDIPKDERLYLKVKTGSAIQQDLSTYYDLENDLSKKLREENDMWIGKLKGPDSEQLTDAEFNAIMEHVQAGRRREHGLHIATIDSFIKKHPANTIIPHIISNMDYKTDPASYLLLYNKLNAEAQNNPEGKLIGKELRELAK